MSTLKNILLLTMPLCAIQYGLSLHSGPILHHDDHIELLEHCAVRIESAKKQALDNVRILALAMHPRLGTDSPLANLDQDSWRTLCKSIIETELQDIDHAKLHIRSFGYMVILPESDIS